MPGTIVAGFDPESADRAPVALARTLADAMCARLLVVAVLPGGSEFDRLARLEAASPLTPPARLGGTRVETVDAPSAAHGLHAVLERVQPVVLVLGSRFRAPHGCLSVGSTGERLLDGAPCAVALAPCGYAHRPLREVVAAALPGPEEAGAVSTASEVATGSGALLRVVTVILRSRAVLPEDPRRYVYIGEPADTLLRTSDRADLLVLGSRSYGPRRCVLAGGVARAVIAGARCPVLMLPRAG